MRGNVADGARVRVELLGVSMLCHMHIEVPMAGLVWEWCRKARTALAFGGAGRTERAWPWSLLLSASPVPSTGGRCAGAVAHTTSQLRCRGSPAAATATAAALPHGVGEHGDFDGAGPSTPFQAASWGGEEHGEVSSRPRGSSRGSGDRAGGAGRLGLGPGAGLGAEDVSGGAGVRRRLGGE